jgi:DNA-directed RNA polymerase specialized sigma subunit
MDKRMTAKAYLSQIRTIHIRLKSMGRQVQSLNDALTHVTPVISDMPRSASPDVHRFDGLIAAKVDLENEIKTDSAKLAEITRTINTLPNMLHSAIITSRYVSDMGWREIADELHISRSHIYELHREALSEVEKSVVHHSKS